MRNFDYKTLSTFFNDFKVVDYNHIKKPFSYINFVYDDNTINYYSKRYDIVDTLDYIFYSSTNNYALMLTYGSLSAIILTEYDNILDPIYLRFAEDMIVETDYFDIMKLDDNCINRNYKIFERNIN